MAVRKSPRGKKKASSKPAAKSKSAANIPNTKSSESSAADVIRLEDLSTEQKRAIRAKLYELVRKTKQDSTICPSQIPRALNQEDRKLYPDWRALMDPVRSIVWEEVRQGKVQVTQKGEVRKYEDRNNLKGPIRVKRGSEWEDT